jgi:hypothetical protein
MLKGGALKHKKAFLEISDFIHYILGSVLIVIPKIWSNHYNQDYMYY